MFNSFDMKRFGSKLKKIRSECNLSQGNVSKLCSVSIDTLRRIENGYVTPRYETLVTLTNVYKRDLLQLFSDFTQDFNLLTYYNRIDEAILGNDPSIASNLYDELVENVLNEDITNNQVDQINYKQIIAFLKARKMYYERSETQKEDIENTILNALQLRIPNYEIKDFDNYVYTHIELRLLIVLARNYDNENTNKLRILKSINKALMDDSYDKYNLRLRLMILYNLSYTSYNLLKDSEAIEWASDAIALALENKTGYLLPNLYARRATSNFLLNQPYEKDIRSCVAAIDLFYDDKFKKEFKRAYEKRGMKTAYFDN